MCVNSDQPDRSELCPVCRKRYKFLSLNSQGYGYVFHQQSADSGVDNSKMKEKDDDSGYQVG